mgnify:CR=1 FL=1|tara:strand:- start:10334 stop:11032 length:699 start_codon:yes stop_codon:yes gene_type:complete
MKQSITSLVAAAWLLAPPVAAQDNPVVVELFTSQGCSSCPAADEMLAEIATREDIIALALHVDYWDYIGWQDTFGDPVHSDRQRAYAAKGQRRSVFTPEMIVQGQSDIVGAKPMALMKAVAHHADQPAKVSLELARNGNDLTIKAHRLTALPGPLTLHLLRYTPLQTTQIMRGENAGRAIEYANIVEGWTVLGEWDGKTALSMQAEVQGPKPVVVLVQARGTGPILAAARVK